MVIVASDEEAHHKSNCQLLSVVIYIISGLANVKKQKDRRETGHQPRLKTAQRVRFTSISFCLSWHFGSI